MQVRRRLRKQVVAWPTTYLCNLHASSESKAADQPVQLYRRFCNGQHRLSQRSELLAALMQDRTRNSGEKPMHTYHSVCEPLAVLMQDRTRRSCQNCIAEAAVSVSQNTAGYAPAYGHTPSSAVPVPAVTAPEHLLCACCRQLQGAGLLRAASMH